MLTIRCSTAALFAFASISTTVCAKPRQVGMNVGMVHPDFRLPTLDGGFDRLSAYRGKKVLLIHFASW